jgi:hypothetical protein
MPFGRSSSRVGSTLSSLDVRVDTLEARIATLEERCPSLEVALQEQQRSCQEFQENISMRIDQIASSLQVEIESSERFKETLDERCASREIVDSLQQEIADLHQRLSDVHRPQAEATLSPEALQLSKPEHQANLEHIQERLAQQDMQLERLCGALSGNGDQLRSFMDEETQRQNNLRVEGPLAEWLIRDVETWLEAFPRGKFLDSPLFSVDAPGVGRLDQMRLRFFPNGGANSKAPGTCSLYLSHPESMPWAQYELMVGRSRRGTFDPIFAGSDDFCPLGPELFLHEDAKAVRLCVRFLPLTRVPPTMDFSQAIVDGPSPVTDGVYPGTRLLGATGMMSGLGKSGLASWGESPQTEGLWRESNRLLEAV